MNATVPGTLERATYEDAMQRLRIYFDESRDFQERLQEAYPCDGVYPRRTWVHDARDVVMSLLDIGDETEGDPIGWKIIATGNDGSVLCQSPSGNRRRYWFLGREKPAGDLRDHDARDAVPARCVCGSTDWNRGGRLGAHCCKCDRDLVFGPQETG